MALKEPVKALHAAEEVYKGTIARIEVTVLGAASKAPVRLPDKGKLSKGAALVLVKNLVLLADPRFMKLDPPAKPGKLDPSGDGEVDRLLELSGEVVAQWNDLKTLAEARKIWQQVQPRLSALLGEAEKAPIGLKRSELAPALDAVVNITSRVKSGPGSVANSQANTPTDLPPLSRRGSRSTRWTDGHRPVPQVDRGGQGEINKFASNPVIATRTADLAGPVRRRRRPTSRRNGTSRAQRHYGSREDPRKEWTGLRGKPSRAGRARVRDRRRRARGHHRRSRTRRPPVQGRTT